MREKDSQFEPPSDGEFRVERGFVSMDLLVFSDASRRMFRQEFDPNRIAYTKKALAAGRVTTFPLLVKPVDMGTEGVHYEVLHKHALAQAMSELGATELEVIVVHDDAFDLQHASVETLLFLGEQGTKIDRLEVVPVNSLVLEGRIIDDEHRRELEDQMGAEGQKIPIWVRVRRDEQGSVVRDVVDGYHRSGAMSALQLELAEARSSYNMTDEELYDQRVLAANSVASVKYARVINWMQLSFEESVWYKEKHLKMSSVLGLAVNAKTTKHPGRNMGLSDDEAQEAITWARNKVKLWKGELTSIYQQIRAAEFSFPEIIDQVRNSSGGGHKGNGVFNSLKFLAMVEMVPQNLQLQHVMVSIIKEHNINADEVRVVGEALMKAQDDQAGIEALLASPLDAAAAILTPTEVVEVEPEENSSIEPFPVQEAPRRKGRLLYTYHEPHVERAQSLLAAPDVSSNGQGFWWNNPDMEMSDAERHVMRLAFEEGRSIEEICNEMNISEAKFTQYLLSAQRRFALVRASRDLMKRFRK